MNLVSVCIPTYNGEKYILEALNSIKKQTYRNIEIIISDDQSQDRTLEICEKFASEATIPVHIYHHSPAGIGANWNFCIEKSNGKYIKFLFQDDLLQENCIDKMVNSLLNTNTRAVFCKRNIIDETSRPLTGKWVDTYGDLQKSSGILFEEKKIFRKKDLKLLGRKTPLSYNFAGEPVTMLIEKGLFSEIGPFNTKLKQLLDLEYAYRILAKTPILFISEKLVSFRTHAEQTSSLNRNNNVNENKIIQNFVHKKFFIYLTNREKINALKTIAKKIFYFGNN